MRETGFFHHLGTFLLLAASILLLITTISAPVVHDIAILKVTLTNRTNFRHSSVTFGTFGHCVLGVAPAQTDQDYCSPKHISYNPSAIMAQIDGSSFSTASEDTTKRLTRVMILHPIACGLAFIAFLLALGSGMFGTFLASLVSSVTCVLAMIVMATDFVTFGLVKRHVNHDNSGSHAYYSAGMWTLVAAVIILFFASLIVFLSCFSARMHGGGGASKGNGYVGAQAATTPTRPRRRFWPRRTRY